MYNPGFNRIFVHVNCVAICLQITKVYLSGNAELVVQITRQVTEPTARTTEICCHTHTEYLMQSLVNFKHFIIS